MGNLSIIESELVGKSIAKSISATFFREKNRFIIQKSDKINNIYLRIHIVHNYVNDLTDISVERGSLYDKKPYVKEVIKDVECLSTTFLEKKEYVSNNVVTFIYTYGDRFSIITVDDNMILSWISAIDRRKILEGNSFPEEIAPKRRKFKNIF